MRKPAIRRALFSAAGRILTRLSRAPGQPEPRRVLVIRPDHLGDLLFAAPALRLLRTWLPRAHITALVGPWSAEVVSRSPYVDQVQTYAFPWFDRVPKGSLLSPYRQLARKSAQLRVGRYDLAVVLRFDHWWGALLTALAGIPERSEERRVGKECRL